MRCYSCGSGEGTESTLCPSCRAKRTDIFKTTIREKVIVSNKLEKKFVFQVYKDIVFRGIAGILVLALLSGVYNYVDSGIFPFLAPVEQKVLTRCLNLAAHQLERKIRGENNDEPVVSQKKFNAIGEFLASLKGHEETKDKLQALKDGDGKACDELWNICKEPDMQSECNSLVGRI